MLPGPVVTLILHFTPGLQSVRIITVQTCQPLVKENLETHEKNLEIEYTDR